VTLVEVPIKDDQGYLRGEAIPKVTMVRHNRWIKDTAMANADEEPEIFARVEKNLRDRPLSGIVAEGSTPYGAMQESMEKALTITVFSGVPVVRVSRGDTAGMVAVNADDIFIEGNNLTAGKARMLLMAALMKFGSLPPAADPKNPTPEEKKAVQEKIKEYQEVFNTH
jgi:L-asparaginase